VQDTPASATSSEGFSVETLAIAVTALLSVGSYILQAKLARDAERAERDHDRSQADREKSAARAGLRKPLHRARVQHRAAQ
jgi:hypothetical protein